MAMKILLQQKATGLYFKDVGAWTHNTTEALDFISLGITKGSNSASSLLSYCWIELVTGLNWASSLAWYGLIQLGALFSGFSSSLASVSDIH